MVQTVRGSCVIGRRCCSSRCSRQKKDTHGRLNSEHWSSKPQTFSADFCGQTPYIIFFGADMYSLSRSLTRGLDAARKTVWRKCGARSFTATSVPGEADEEVKALSQISTQSIVDALWLNDYPQPYIHGARPMRENMKCAGRAVTLRFVPHRPDVAADKPQGVRTGESSLFAPTLCYLAYSLTCKLLLGEQS